MTLPLTFFYVELKMKNEFKRMSKEDYKDLLKMQEEIKLTEKEIEGFLEFYKLKKTKIKILNRRKK